MVCATWFVLQGIQESLGAYQLNVDVYLPYFRNNVYMGVHIGCRVLGIQLWTAHRCCLHIYPRNLCYLECTSYATVKSCGIINDYSSCFHMHFWTLSSLFLEQPLMLSVYWLQSENRLASDIKLVKCTLNCTGTLLTKSGGCMCCLLTSLYQVTFHLLPAKYTTNYARVIWHHLKTRCSEHLASRCSI